MGTTPAHSTSASPRPVNRLAREKSPYLLQHQYNPVDWYAWGEEAFAKAQHEGKPIFLSIGYSTCHWCHVMERESFEAERVAKILNAHFVSIKVDREERPDVDKIYMTFVQSTTGQGGWPLNVFLTPDRNPFFGGTYFPPENRYGRPSFAQLLEHINQLWVGRKPELEQSAAGIQQQLARFSAAHEEAAEAPGEATLRRAGESFKGMYDPRHGGFGGAPKFPQPSFPLFLLRYARRFGDLEAQRMVLHTCDRMAAGGMNDQLGGGFARYSVVAEWLVPHFEKMLYDQAQLVQLYLDAFLVSGESRYADVARATLDYVLRDLSHPDGGFFSAEDADSEGQEGKFYCWTRAELSRLLTPEEFNVAVRYFGITEAGNFVDHSHPEPLPNLNVLSIAHPDVPEADRPLLESAQAKMRAARAGRVRPHLDDKVLGSWNGLMLGAFARASVILGDARYRATAERNAAFLREKLWEPAREGRPAALYHRWRDGERDQVQLLQGYAFPLSGLLHLYEATLSPAHLAFAIEVAESLVSRFFDADQGGFWQSLPDAPDLILCVKDDYDGAEPSGNSVAVLALLRLGKITGRADLIAAAERTITFFAHRLEQLPQGMSFLLHALDFQLGEPLRAAVSGDPTRPETQALLSAIHGVYQPNKVVLGTQGPVEEFARTLPVGTEPLVYACTGTACQAPTKDPQVIRASVSGGGAT